MDVRFCLDPPLPSVRTLWMAPNECYLFNVTFLKVALKFGLNTSDVLAFSVFVEYSKVTMALS